MTQPIGLVDQFGAPILKPRHESEWPWLILFQVDPPLHFIGHARNLEKYLAKAPHIRVLGHVTPLPPETAKERAQAFVKALNDKNPYALKERQILRAGIPGWKAYNS